MQPMYERYILPKVGDIYLYTVRQGDYPYEIANRYNANLDKLLGINGLNEHSVLQIGQELLIPVMHTQPQPMRYATSDIYPNMYY